MSHPDAGPADVHVEVHVEAPYNSTPVRLRAWSQDDFVLRIADGPQILACETGTFAGPGTHEVRAEEEGARRRAVSVTLIGALRPESVFPDRPPAGPQSALGNRWYPFISSRLRLELRPLDGRVASFVLSLGPDLVARTRVDANVGPTGTPERHTALASDCWTYALWWPDAEDGNLLGIDLPLQMSVSVVAREIMGSALSLVVALAVIAVSGHLDKNAAQLAAAGLGGYLLVLLRQWLALPHVGRFSALAWFYIVCGLMAIPWAIGWGHHEGRTWWELLVIVPWFVASCFIVPYFQANGRPPRWYAVTWRRVVLWAEQTRDLVRDPWQLRQITASFDGEEAVGDRLPDGSVLLQAPQRGDGPPADAIRFARRGHGFEVTRLGPDRRMTVLVFSGGSLLRAIRRTGADLAPVRALLRERECERSALAPDPPARPT